MTHWPEQKLGFGLMRLPTDDSGAIDHQQVCRMADTFLENGFTYFDTAYVYGGSEEAFRKAVVERHPRDRFTVASKLPGWALKEDVTPADLFQESLDRCGITYFDYYLLHSLQESNVQRYTDEVWSFVRQMRQEGRIRHLGFSFHGGPELLERLLTDHPDVEFVQLQINYVDWDNDVIASRRNYEVCQKFGKDVVVMEPVKGGLLAGLKPQARALLDACDPSASSASYALRFAASLPGVRVVLSGMSDQAQLDENVSIFKPLHPLSQQEEAAVKAAGSLILNTPTIPCTACRYCEKGCPKGIHIPDIFKYDNMLEVYGEHARPHTLYGELMEQGGGRAGDCIQCGQCEAACPQHIHIIEHLAKASQRLDP